MADRRDQGSKRTREDRTSRPGSGTPQPGGRSSAKTPTHGNAQAPPQTAIAGSARVPNVPPPSTSQQATVPPSGLTSTQAISSAPGGPPPQRTYQAPADVRWSQLPMASAHNWERTCHTDGAPVAPGFPIVRTYYTKWRNVDGFAYATPEQVQNLIKRLELAFWMFAESALYFTELVRQRIHRNDESIRLDARKLVDFIREKDNVIGNREQRLWPMPTTPQVGSRIRLVPSDPPRSYDLANVQAARIFLENAGELLEDQWNKANGVKFWLQDPTLRPSVDPLANPDPMFPEPSLRTFELEP